MERINNEKRFHNKAFAENTRDTTSKFYAITQRSRNYYLDFLKSKSTCKKTLEYGCGPGSSAFFLANNGATVTGIDISEHAISTATEAAKKEGLKVDFKVMNAENLKFDKDSYQLACGSGIIHHLDIQKAYSELARVLTPDGAAIFLEPLGHNPLINWYRKRTPHLRTPDEHPLIISDLINARQFFQEVEFNFFHLTSLVTVPFRDFYYFTKLLKMFDKIDSTMFKLFPFSRKYAWAVIITLQNPRK